MKKTLISTGVIAALVGVALLANQAEAKLAVNASTTADSVASTSVKRAVKLDKVTANLQARADKEIDRRVVNLNKLQDKLQEMKKLSSADKSSFVTTIQGQINLLDNLKVKINADTDAATLKTDVQSITKAYRIYALVLPQTQIVAAADRLASTTDLLTAYVAKLQTRVTMAQNAGKDVTALQALLTDMGTKIADAGVQAAKAIAGVSFLKPDNGDKTVMASNAAALKDARTAVRVGTQDLKDANKDGQKILKALKAFAVKSTATTTATTTSE